MLGLTSLTPHTNPALGEASALLPSMTHHESPRTSVGKRSELSSKARMLALPLQAQDTWITYAPTVVPSLTSESISIATGTGRRGGALGPDDRGKGTLLFDSRKN